MARTGGNFSGGASAASARSVPASAEPSGSEAMTVFKSWRRVRQEQASFFIDGSNFAGSVKAGTRAATANGIGGRRKDGACRMRGQKREWGNVEYRTSNDE